MKKMTCCILDGETTNPGDLSWEGLEALCDVAIHPRTPPEDIVPRAKDAEIVITNKVVLTKEVLGQLDRLRAVCLLSTGVNSADLAACRGRGIPVCNIPAYSTASVAEHTFALMLAWARGVESHSRAVQCKEWTRSEDFCFTLTPQRELAGRTLGLYGFGDIAQSVAKIAGAFGMRVLAHTPHPECKPDLGQRFVNAERLFAESEIVSLHCPLTPDTEELVNADRLARMREGAVLINTGRGGLLDEAAVAAALESGRLGAALLDVLSAEPPRADNPLPGATNCWITPHVAWATHAARSRLMDILTGNVRAFLEGSPRNVVNGV